MKRSSNKKRYRVLNNWKKSGIYIVCMITGIVLFLSAEILDQSHPTVENGILLRNSYGKGDVEYDFLVDGLSDSEDSDRMQSTKIEILVPEQKLTDEQFQELLPEMMETLCLQILGENDSLAQVSSDLILIRELSDYGVSVSWKSESPEFISDQGILFIDENSNVCNETCFLEAKITNGSAEEIFEIPIIICPKKDSIEVRFQKMLEEIVLTNQSDLQIVLPKQFEGKNINYRSHSYSENSIWLILGITAAICLYLRDREKIEIEKKTREESLMLDYPDLVSDFLILTGAGYSAKTAWTKIIDKSSVFCKEDRTIKLKTHPLYYEMQITKNQMDTGVPETRAYAEFGKRCGTRSYIKFAALLESSVQTGGRNLKKLLEAEVDEAFKLRSDTARRKGEEASSKMVFPMFGMLAVVMIMVISPAFLSIG